MFNHACATIVNGHHTDIALNIYSNKIFLIITQYKKFGSFISVTQESHVNEFSSSIYSAKTLFGKDDVDILAATRYIAEQIDINKPLLVTISLKDYDIETLKQIVKAINKIKLW